LTQPDRQECQPPGERRR